MTNHTPRRNTNSFDEIEQLQCISCQHIFSVEEAAVARRKIICERCQSNNWNWRQRQRQLTHPTIFNQKFLQNTPLVTVGLILVIFLVLIFSWELVDTGNWLRSLISLLFLLLVAFLPLFLFPQQWRDVREYHALRQVVPSPNPLRRLTPPDRWALALLGSVVLVIPVLGFLVLPLTDLKGQDLVTATPELSLAERINRLSDDLPRFIEQNAIGSQEMTVQALRDPLREMQTMMGLRTNICESDRIDLIIANMQLMRDEIGIPEDMKTPVAEAMARLEAINTQPRETCEKLLFLQAGSALRQIASANTLLTGEPTDECESLVGKYYEDVVKAPSACRQLLANKMVSEVEALEASFLPPDDSQLTPWAVGVLSQAYGVVTNSTDEAAKQKIETHITALENQLYPTDRSTVMAANVSLVVHWIGYVGLVGLIACLTGLTAVRRIAREESPYLPPPVFHRLSLMIQATLWDMKQTLQVTGGDREIRILHARRNGDGGLTLYGVSKQKVNSDRNERSLSSDEPFQVTTDRYARVTEAELTGMLGNLAGPHPSSEVSDDSFPDNGASSRVNVRPKR